MNKHRLRRAQRGAILVESIIVISFFTLCFLGVMYFRELYLAKMHVQRLARASAMAHAMSACKADAKAGLENDLPRPLTQSKAPGSGMPVDLDVPGGHDGEKLASKALETVGDALGMGALDEVTVVTLTTTASATTQTDPSSPKQGFVSDDVSSESFVSCMDPVSDKQFDGIIDHVTDVFTSIF
jgi:hypothetical protein